MSDSMEFRLLDYKIYDEKNDHTKNISTLCIQMFGKNEKGDTFSVKVIDFKPFFFVKVSNDWDKKTVTSFRRDIVKFLNEQDLIEKYDKFKKDRGSIFPKIKTTEDDVDESLKEYIKSNIKTHYSYSVKGIEKFKLCSKHKLYGFDNHALYKFVKLTFTNNHSYNKVKNLWFDRVVDHTSQFGFNNILKTYKYKGVETEIYEAKLPPILRFFHIKEINPSGWVRLVGNVNNVIDGEQRGEKVSQKKTLCDYEYIISHENIISLREKETVVPIKICSFDIEASSSHGDFPLSKKEYKKLSGELQQHWDKYRKDIGKLTLPEQKGLLFNQINTAFGISEFPADGISVVYPKNINGEKEEVVKACFNKLISTELRFLVGQYKKNAERCKGKPGEMDKTDSYVEEIDEELYKKKYSPKLFVKCKNNSGKKYYLIDCLLDEIDTVKKVEFINMALSIKCPALEGDKVTFIGSTFMIVGEKGPYLNHGVCLGNCNDIEMKHSDVEIVCCEDEEDVLLEWSEIIKREKPDVIIGYNIFGFDYKFMLERAEENGCDAEFRSLGKNSVDSSTYRHRVCNREEKVLKIASGSHELIYINIDGIIQIDLYNYFRREVNLSSYKLQDVASHYIGDIITHTETMNESLVENNEGESKMESKNKDDLKQTTLIKSRNLMGLEEDNYVIFEIMGHSLDAYDGGKKYKVLNVDEKTGEFLVDGHVVMSAGSKMRWGLGKDDVSPADLFHAFSEKGTDEDRTVIAKYCFQDCNLVHNLMRKNDILTGMSEIAAICYVPIDYIIMRGQGIKLMSFISKKCNEKNTLMPVLEKKNDGGYEGAICLPPKCGFYSNKPVAVVDYASLYPSSMISENISHDSKVTTKEYDLNGNLICESGNEDYNNLHGFNYVDIEYDRYEYKIKEGKTKADKEKVGTKICRFVQFPNNEKAIMPSILTDLLASRKYTRELIKYKDLARTDGSTISGLLSEKDNNYIIKNKAGIFTIPKNEVTGVTDTNNYFMKNVLNQRQLGFKTTANSLYGQCGARTSSFYEKDIAASTTATGRKLLIYAKEIITKVYNNRVCDTTYGKVTCKGDVIYGDTDSCFFIFNPRNEDGIRFKGKEALEITIELAIQAGQLASKFLKLPHDLEYEKTFDPFLLLSKKRYVGILYENDINKGSEKSMGIVLKRRDNADVVKDIYGGVINILMNEGNIQKSVKFTRTFLQNIINGDIEMKKLIISKALRSWYKIPESIAHKVLADRMGERDSGNKPAVGSRIPYAYIQTKKNVKLQGDKIEHPDYIVKHNLKLDYGFYITNQIMKPLQQLFSLILENIPEYSNKIDMLKSKIRSIKNKHEGNPEKITQGEMKLRNAEVKNLIFSKYLNICNNKKNNNSTIEKYFKYK